MASIFRDELKGQRVLFIGCGGGYDVFFSLPFAQSCFNAVFANITFVDEDKFYKQWKRDRGIYYVEYDEKIEEELKDDGKVSYPKNYLPEFWLSKYVKQGVYAFLPTGVKTLTNVLQTLHDLYSFDSIVVVDGGLDSMMFGDEEDIGSFAEDVATVLAVANVCNKEDSPCPGAPSKYLVCTAWGAEGLVSHNQFFDNVATINRTGAFIGAQYLPLYSTEGQYYYRGLEQSFPENSTINCAAASSLEGIRRDQAHRWYYRRFDKEEIDEMKTPDSIQTWLGNPLGGFWWMFHLNEVARHIIYADKLQDTNSIDDVIFTVHRYRYDHKLVDDEGNYSGNRTTKYF